MKHYRLCSILDMTRHLMRHVLTSQSIAADLTCGNGHDTLFLAPLVKKLYAVDIQEAAICQTKQLCAVHTNISYHCASHTHIAAYIHEPLDLAVFNLGYMPSSNKQNKTNAQTTAIALRAAYDMLKENGCILVTSYVGHDGGTEEYAAVMTFMDEHTNTDEIIRYEFYNAPKSAKIIMISRRSL